MQIAEPLLQFSPMGPGGVYDAGDTPSFMVAAAHQEANQQTSAFRFILTYNYLAQFLSFNENDPGSANFLINLLEVANFTTNATIIGDRGFVPYAQDEKRADDTFNTELVLVLENAVQSNTEYQVPFEVVWHSLPYDYEGGRSYSASGVMAFSTANMQMQITYETSNPLTPDNNLQTQENISVYVTVTFPEVYT